MKAKKRGEEIPREHRKAVRTYRKVLRFARAVVRLHEQTGGQASFEKSVFTDHSGAKHLLILVFQIGKVESSKAERASFQDVYGSKVARKAIRKELARYSRLCSNR